MRHDMRIKAVVQHVQITPLHKCFLDSPLPDQTPLLLQEIRPKKSLAASLARTQMIQMDSCTLP